MKKLPNEATRNPRRASSAKPAAVEARRQALVRAAFEIIAENGFEGLRTRDTATRAGMTVTTLHYYFEGKEALVQGVGEYLEQLLKTDSSATPAQSTALPTPQHLFDPLLVQLQQEPKAFIVLSEFLLRSRRDLLLRPMMQELERVWRAKISATLESGINQGFIRSDIDVQATAITLVALIQGMALQSTINSDVLDLARALKQFESLVRV